VTKMRMEDVRLALFVLGMALIPFADALAAAIWPVAS